MQSGFLPVGPCIISTDIQAHSRISDQDIYHCRCCLGPNARTTNVHIGTPPAISPQSSSSTRTQTHTTPLLPPTTHNNTPSNTGENSGHQNHSLGNSLTHIKTATPPIHQTTHAQLLPWNISAYLDTAAAPNQRRAVHRQANSKSQMRGMRMHGASGLHMV